MLDRFDPISINKVIKQVSFHILCCTEKKALCARDGSCAGGVLCGVLANVLAGRLVRGSCARLVRDPCVW